VVCQLPFGCNNKTLDRYLKRPYSKVDKSTRAEVAVIFAYFRLSVIAFCVVAAIKKCELVSKETFFIVETTQK
jgi:hypothetical protein